MTKDEDYGFDVAGFIRVPRVLNNAEVKACNNAIDAVGRNEGMLQWSAPWRDAFRVLQEHPVLQAYLEALCGPDFVVDRPLSMIVPDQDVTDRVQLRAGDPQHHRRLRYVCQGGERTCHGVRVVWALAPTTASEGGLVLVPASHKRWMEPSVDVLDATDAMGMTVEPQLEAGDLLLCAATTLHGVRGQPGRLLVSQAISAGAMPSDGYDPVAPPAWTSDLTPEQMAVVGPRTTGNGGTLVSDGTRTRLVEAVEQSRSIEDVLDGDFAPDPKELWFWDVRGYLVVRGVMDEAWLAAAHQAIDATIAAQGDLPPGHRSAFEEVPEAIFRENAGQWPAETSARIRGDIHRPRIGGLYELPAPHCEPFKRMIAHPAIVRRLNWMLGSGFRESWEPMCCIYPRGTTGGSLHGQAEYALINGRPYVNGVNVAWALHDEAGGFGDPSGGFVCVPGSHKASFEIPGSETTSIDLPQVTKPALQAGDVLFFGGVAHGTTAWRAGWDRRTVIQFMGARHRSVRPGDAVALWRWSTDKGNPSNEASTTLQRPTHDVPS
jgi:ectoine hydroxylase-related dioxygenase (phytanoyl-CoA dioxygenase family)